MKKTTAPKNPSPELGHCSSTLQPCWCFLPKGLDLSLQRTVNSCYLQDGSHEDRHPGQDENNDTGDSLLPETTSLSQDHNRNTNRNPQNSFLQPTASGRWLDPDPDLCFKPPDSFVTLFGDQRSTAAEPGAACSQSSSTNGAAALPVLRTAVLRAC